MTRRILHLLAIGALAAALVACSTSAAQPTSPGTAPVDEATATAMARNALEGYNRGDYAMWARDWSDTMLAAIRDADFQGAREQLMTTLGPYVSIDAVTYAETKPGVHRYTFQVTFEKQAASFWLGFAAGSPKVEGVKFE